MCVCVCAQLYVFIFYLGEWGGWKECRDIPSTEILCQKSLACRYNFFRPFSFIRILVVFELEFNYCIGCFAGTEPYCRSWQHLQLCNGNVTLFWILFYHQRVVFFLLIALFLKNVGRLHEYAICWRQFWWNFCHRSYVSCPRCGKPLQNIYWLFREFSLDLSDSPEY